MYDSNDYLAHHGVLGQKWGVRRYQNKDGSLTAEGRKRAGLKPESKFAKRRADAAKKKAAKKAEKDLNDKENLKSYLRKHPKQLPRHSTELTREEAEAIIKDIEFDRKLKDVRDAEVQRTWKKISNMESNAKTISNALTTSKSIYNSVAEINNLLVDTGKIKGNRWTKLGDKPEVKDNKDERDAWVRTLKPEYVRKNHTDFSGDELANYVKRQNSLEALDKIINPQDDKDKKNKK